MTYPKYQVTVPMWLEFPQEVRAEFVRIFGLQKSSGVTTFSTGGVSKMTCDGHTNEDLAGISIEKMQEFLGTDGGDFWKLLEATFDKVVSAMPSPQEGACAECGGKGKHKKTCAKHA